MSHDEIEAKKQELRDIAYQYIKTGLFEYLEKYFHVSNELLSLGVKPEHLPILRK